MAKVGMSKNTAKTAVAARQVQHQHVDAKVFNVDDPTAKLIHMVGGGFFNEPQYYSTGESKRDSRGRAVSNPQDEQGMGEQARSVIDTAKAVALTNPEDLLIIANWVRTDLKLRTTPTVLLAIAAAEPSCRPFLKKYMPVVIQRADEIRQTFAAYNHLFNLGKDGKRIKGLPHSLAKGLRDALLKFRESDFMKYDTPDRPSFGDVALMLRERKRLPKPIFEFLVNGKILDEKATPVFALRKKLNAKDKFDDEAKQLAKGSFATWENLVSQFGGTKEVWEFLIDSGLLRYMAMLRNLRNLEGAGISEAHWDKVVTKLSTETGNKQLPFRFLAARRQVTGQNAISAVDAALDKAVENVPELPGTTFIMVDSSGSMDQPVSSKSKMSKKDAGYTLSAILAKKVGRKTIIAVFGTDMKVVPFSASDSTMAVVQNMEREGNTVQHSTHAYLALQYLLARGNSSGVRTRSMWGYDDVGRIVSPIPAQPLKVDRIVIVSDMACYGQDNLGQLLEEYRRTVNPNVNYYSINMSGQDQSQVDPLDKNALLISGWSESIFTLIREFEGLKTDGEKQDVSVPAIELLRERFKVA